MNILRYELNDDDVCDDVRTTVRMPMSVYKNLVVLSSQSNLTKSKVIEQLTIAELDNFNNLRSGSDIETGEEIKKYGVLNYVSLDPDEEDIGINIGIPVSLNESLMDMARCTRSNKSQIISLLINNEYKSYQSLIDNGGAGDET